MNIRILSLALALSACSESKLTPIDDQNDDATEDVDIDEGPPDDTPIVDEDTGIKDSGSPCIDDDGDGICNEEDACEGHDDTIDTDADGVADGCDPCPAGHTEESDGEGI